MERGLGRSGLAGGGDALGLVGMRFFVLAMIM
jgi:hypothetical protein